MSEVAREARVSKALIFWHFKTKEELFVAVLNRLLEPYFIDFAEEAGALDERAQIQKLVEFYLLFVRDNASSVRFFIAQMLHDQHFAEGLSDQVLKLYTGYRAMLVELIARGQERNLCARRFTPGICGGISPLGAQRHVDRASVSAEPCARSRDRGCDGSGMAVPRRNQDRHCRRQSRRLNLLSNPGEC